jgi:hypothetical protein
MINISVTPEELEMIQTSLVFTSCTEACYKNNWLDQIRIATLANKLHEVYKQEPSCKVYLFEGDEPENTKVFQILEKFTNKKQR